jgi:hypothetical protein
MGFFNWVPKPTLLILVFFRSKLMKTHVKDDRYAIFAFTSSGSNSSKFADVRVCLSIPPNTILHITTHPPIADREVVVQHMTDTYITRIRNQYVWN